MNDGWTLPSFPGRGNARPPSGAAGTAAVAATDRTIAPTRGRAAPSKRVERMAVALVYAAALYPWLLCFLNTRVARMPNAALIVAEGVILVGALPLIALRLNLGMLLLCLCLATNFSVLAIFQQELDVKALRDLLMPVVFVWLGYIVASRDRAERVLRNLAFGAAAVGLVEYLFPSFYQSLFDTIAFYAARGFGASNPFALTVLQVRPNGIGRSLLPFLGPRRMSSFFLEPVALGNFAVLTAAWALSKPREEWREAAWLMLFAAIMIIEADARFGSITILALFMVRLTRVYNVRLAAALMPFGMVTILMLTFLYGPKELQDNIVGRMQVSGGNLVALPLSGWFGIPAFINFDAGYGYILQRTGLVICLLLWFVFATLPINSGQARHFHCNAALYISLNLCISGSSLFSLKTTAILWLLLGAIIAHRSPSQPLVAADRADDPRVRA